MIRQICGERIRSALLAEKAGIARFGSTQRRNVVFVSRSRSKKSKPRQQPSEAQKRNPHEFQTSSKLESSLSSQIQFLEQFTSRLENIVKEKQDTRAQEKIKKELEVDEEVESFDEIDKDASEIFEALMLADGDSKTPLLSASESGVPSEVEEPDPMMLFPKVKPYKELPLSIFEKLNDETTKYITSKESEDWVPVIDRLYNTTGLANCSSYDIHILIKQIPKHQRPLVIAKIHKMAVEARKLHNVHLYNDIMAAYNLVNVRESLPILEMMMQEMERKGIKPNLNTYSIMINLYSKHKDVKAVRDYVSKIYEIGEKPSMVTYTTVLQLYVRMNQYEQVLETFNTMKFLSVETSPSPTTYSSVILMDVLNNNIEHALSLYEEMKNKGIQPEDQALLALAKGCSTRQALYETGWSFIQEYYAQGHMLEFKVMEIMMSLASKDSDINFVRALYISIFSTKTKARGELTPAGPSALKFLFNAYHNFDPKRTPVTLISERIRPIRHRTMELCDFGFHSEAPPFLPMLSLKDDKLILQEMEAILNYHLLRFPDCVSKEVVEAYLFVHAKRGASIANFEKLWSKFTFLKTDGESHVTLEEPAEDSITTEEDEVGTTPAARLAQETTRKFPRDDGIYLAALTAARIAKDVSFAQKIWIERGQYRKSQAFQRLKPAKQDELDFKFARAMLSCLVETGNVVDGYQLVLGSQKRFAWTYYHLKSLMMLAERLGYNTVSKELSKVINKANRNLRKHKA